MTTDFLEAVRKIMVDARAVIKSKTFVLPYDGLVDELTAHYGMPAKTAHEMLFEATMAGDLAPYWRNPDLNALNFALIPKEDLCAQH